MFFQTFKSAAVLGPMVAGLLLTASFANAQSVIHVDGDATGADNGTSWADAFTDLQSALDAAEASERALTEIHVAAGTYRPSKRTDPADPRSATFRLVNRVTLMGGYGGMGATDPNTRAVGAYVTTLSGDLAGDDDAFFLHYDENVYHVVTASDADEQSRLDGFWIQGGNANGSGDNETGGGIFNRGGSLTVANCTITENRAGSGTTSAGNDAGSVACGCGSGGAGGVHNEYPGAPTFEDCSFIRNHGGAGGTFWNFGTTPATFRSCVFQLNDARCGGAVYNNGGEVSLNNCTFDGNIAGSFGGAIAQQSGGSVALVNSRLTHNVASIGGAIGLLEGGFSASESLFAQNQAETWGGGIYVGGWLVEMTDCTFDQNLARFGGAAWIESGYPGTVSHCTFSANFASDGAGGVNVEYGPVAFSDCVFEVNSSSGPGGGAFIEGESDFTSCRFQHNGASEGGGLYARSAVTKVTDTTFFGNSAQSGGGLAQDSSEGLSVARCRFMQNFADVGGGMWTNAYAWLEVSDSLFVDNFAAAYGGALASASPEFLLRNCTVGRNKAGALGAGLICAGGTAIRNSILWGNMVAPDAGAYTDEFAQIEGIHLARIDHSTVQGWTGVFGGVGNSGVDPLFADPVGPDSWPGTGDEDYRLSPGSPAINAGDPGYVSPPGDADLDGHARVLCGRVDIGAYEFGIGDYDCNRAADLSDFAAWPACMTGPDAATIETGCEAFDFNADGKVTLADYAGLQRSQFP